MVNLHMIKQRKRVDKLPGILEHQNFFYSEYSATELDRQIQHGPYKLAFELLDGQHGILENNVQTACWVVSCYRF